MAKKRAKSTPAKNAPATEPADSTRAASSVKAARERREERQRQQQQSVRFQILLVVGVLAIIGFLLVLTRTSPSDAPVPENLGAAYSGLPRGVDENGFPRLGNPNAPVRIVEYSSFGCPGCAAFHTDIFPQLVARIREGYVNFTFIPQFTGSGNVMGANRVALCAQEQGKFWEMHDVLFGWHDQFLTNAFTDPRLRQGAGLLSLDEGQFNQCLTSDRTNNLIALAQQLAVPSTPTVRVNGQQVENTLDAINTAISGIVGNLDLSQFQPYPETEIVPTAADSTEATSAAPEATESAPAEATSEAAPAEATSEATAEATAAQ
jgi:protein-disulfide isomerase